MPKAADHIIQS